MSTLCEYNYYMLDGLILQAVLTALVIIAMAFAIVWLVSGITGKIAVWIIGLVVPLALGLAVVVAVLSG